ncbi:MAG: alpha/beta hydrolase [Pseudomonadota bacterium]
MKSPSASLLAAVTCALLSPTAPARAETPAPCTVGLYGTPPHEFVIITQSEDGFDYSFQDGRGGAVGAPNGQVTCAGAAVQTSDNAFWPRVDLQETDVVFSSAGTELAGRLIEPPGASASTPLAVIAHGSEATGWLDRADHPYQLVARGVSIFVYDKRGTGRSGGTYNQNFPRLAADLTAASTEAKRLAEGRFGRFGLFGLSQGGWVAPLAAGPSAAEFIGIGYGLVADIREEDATQVELDLRRAGHGDAVIAQAREITEATARYVTTLSDDALAAFLGVRDRFRGAPWLADISGDYTGILLNATEDDIRTKISPVFRSYDVDWSLDPVDIVRRAAVPQLWAFAGADRAAPPEQSIARLKTLRAEGAELLLYVFPQTDHGMWQFTETTDGTRTYTRRTPAFYDMMADWAFGALAERYGSAEAL